MKMLESVRKLCSPAYVYLVISVIAMVAMMFQNAGNQTKYQCGTYECPVPSVGAVFLAKGLYVAFWTFILDALCKAGYKQVSWFLVLLPFIMFFVLIGLMILVMADGAVSSALQ
tara:strand:+ start:1200 stop:1541 length:342 start_codon:yes stop_codon:yes gene_type:complete